MKAVRIERMGRDVYIMGAANVGKSAFVRYLPSGVWPAPPTFKGHMPHQCTVPGIRCGRALRVGIL